MKAVIYARYSSENQTEASIEGQLRECMEFANHTGVTVISNYIDRALSAKTDNRPEFQKMIKDSYKHCFDMINGVKCRSDILSMPSKNLNRKHGNGNQTRNFLYYDFRFRRGDNTLLVHILKSIMTWIWKRNVRVYNRYGYNTLKNEKERGTIDGKVEKRNILYHEPQALYRRGLNKSRSGV